MADFKKLSAVEAVNTVSDAATVLIEEDGVIKRAPKADVTDFKKLSDVEVVEAPAETANVLIEENGVIKKAPKTAVGGGGGVEPDMYITVLGYPRNASMDNSTITYGSVDNILSAISESRVPIVKIRYENSNALFELNGQVSWYGSSVTINTDMYGFNGFGSFTCDSDTKEITGVSWNPLPI